MSCNICHTPILVDHRYLNANKPNMVTQTDHLDPIVGRACPAKTHQPYFRKVVQLDRKSEGIVGKGLVHAGRGVFISTHWEIVRGIALGSIQEEVDDNGLTTSCTHVAHEGCLKIYCGQIGVPFDLTQNGKEALIQLLERHEFLGTTLYGGYEGIDYSAGKLDERWSSQPWGDQNEANVFKWDFQNGEEDWTLKRPDCFPRLHEEVKLQRKELCNDPKLSRDRLSTSPELIFIGISSHLGLADLYNLASLNKQVRLRCLTTTSFQVIIRDRLCETWAIPLPSESPSPIPEGFPHRAAHGDWLLYGYHVFKTQSLRNRRRIFNIISQLQNRYIVNATEVGYLHGPYSEVMQMNFKAMVEQQLLLRKVNLMYDYNLFLKVLDTFKNAWENDMRKPKFMGEKVRQAVIKVSALMEGKTAKPRTDPGELVLEMLHAAIKRYLKKTVITAKQLDSRPRRENKANTRESTGNLAIDKS